MLSYPEPFDAVIQAGYGEHGREGLQELLNVPVVDITEAAASTAMFLGHDYSVVTTLDRTVPLIEDRLKLAGLDARCASVRASGLAVLELEEDPERAVEAIVRPGRTGGPQDKAEVIGLGCGGMAGLDEQIRDAPACPWSTASRRRSPSPSLWCGWGCRPRRCGPMPRPRPKTVTGWPLAAVHQAYITQFHTTQSATVN